MPPMCVIFGTSTRIAANASVNRVGAGCTHLVAPRKQAKHKGIIRHDSRQISPDPPFAQTSSISDEAAPLDRYWPGSQSPLSVEAERALEGIVPGWNARFNWRDGGACCSARVGYWTRRDNASYRHCQGVGWLWLGLASGTRSLESVARGMGPGALRPQPPLRHSGPQRQLARSLRQLGTAIRRMATLPRLARPILRLARHRCAAHNPDRSG
jgi:hypothetical protein